MFIAFPWLPPSSSSSMSDAVDAFRRAGLTTDDDDDAMSDEPLREHVTDVAPVVSPLRVVQVPAPFRPYGSTLHRSSHYTHTPTVNLAVHLHPSVSPVSVTHPGMPTLDNSFVRTAGNRWVRREMLATYDAMPTRPPTYARGRTRVQ